MTTHTSKTNPKDLELYEHRAKKVDLIWCKQAISIIEQLPLSEQFSINDIGCNYGQVYKEIKRRGIEKKINYYGYDIDNLFLNMARKFFPENANKFTLLDIEKEVPDQKEVTICSATFEHLDNPEQSLKNMFYATSKHLILRTFVGNESIKFIQDDKKYVATPYNVNQFNLFDIAKIFIAQGFNFCCYKDKATESIPKELWASSGVYRTMMIIVGSKEESC